MVPSSRRILFFVAVAVAAKCSDTSAQELQYPLTVATHGDAIYVVDRTLPGVWKSEGGKLSVFFQASKKFRTPLNAPRCLAIDGEGKLFVGDSSTLEVYRFDDAGEPQPLTSGAILIPMGIAITPKGDLLVSDLDLNRIVQVTLSGEKPTVEKYADVAAPAGVCLDADGRLWVVSRGTNALYRISAEQQVEVVLTGRQFEFPNEIAIDSEGTAFISDGYAKAIWRLEPNGKPEKWFAGEPLVNPVGLAWRGDDLLVVDPRAKAVFQIDKEGKLSAVDLGKSD